MVWHSERRAVDQAGTAFDNIMAEKCLLEMMAWLFNINKFNVCLCKVARIAIIKSSLHYKTS